MRISFFTTVKHPEATNRQKFETELVSVWRVFPSPLELSLPLGGLPAEPVVWPSHNNGPVYGGCCGGGGAVTSPSPASCSRFLSAFAPFSPLFILSPFIYLPLFRHVRPLGPSAEESTPQNYNPDVWLCVCEAGCSLVGGMRKGDETGENEVINSVRRRLLFVLSPLL